jgi:hypothetical protein
MKALTISQPFASMIRDGFKWVENRRWETNHRGPLAIHAGKGTQYLSRAELAEYPTGAIVATAVLFACMPLESMWRMSRRTAVNASALTIGDVLEHEHTEGPWCWILNEVHPCQPLTISGAQGLWEVDLQHCRVCGCTECGACEDDGSGLPCHWVAPDLCSRCGNQ